MVKHILAAVTMVVILCGVLCSYAEAEKQGRRAEVEFRIGHVCYYYGLPRPWIKGEARHWDPRGNLKRETFWHRPGHEKAYMGWQLVGWSRGDARVTVVPWPWSRCRNCQTGLQRYEVKPKIKNIIPMTMRPPR